MFDDFRDLSEEGSFSDELDNEAELYPFPTHNEKRPTKRFLGMTPAQLFLVSIEFFMMVLILGVFFMIVTERMVIPF